MTEFFTAEANPNHFSKRVTPPNSVMRGHCNSANNKWNALSAHKKDVVWVAHYRHGSTFWRHKKPALMRRVAVAPCGCDRL